MGLKLRMEIDRDTLKLMVLEYFREKLGDTPLQLEHIQIEVKSKQNWKSEWEPADFRAVYEVR